FRDVEENFIPKEVTVLAINATITGHWIMRPSYPFGELPERARRENNWLTRNYHGIEWFYGDVNATYVTIHLLWTEPISMWAAMDRANQNATFNYLDIENAHKHKHDSQGRLLSNRGYKYKHIIAPLMSMTPKKQSKKSGKGLPRAMTLNDNAIDYVHWDDPNELVDRLRLLDASHRAGNNAHDNEMLSIIEELCEAGLIIN
ncbi:hypothetical protein ALC57_03150, partial [Trachymyrmex cornetzi]